MLLARTRLFSGERARALRESAGHSLSDVSRGTGLSYNTYSLWELGKRTPTVESLAAVADFFVCDINDFLVANEEVPSDGDLA
ncbi:helix-turn-helix domain-containing protein [Streptomyces acidiscabies]|uniref:helix-turn-helix domain-containing protein n=1 Tax=Streptomyces acidiscabies TaxID=42234 RepID=UPI00067E5CF1|nr:helix-turn-helix transcriptional regulator [Streptomyces acidiscabies]